MITVTENLDGFTVEGHADFADHGMDIVCAGVSTLAQAVSHVLEYRFNAKVTIRSGYIHVSHNTYKNAAQDVENVLWCGVHEIENQFPNHVKVVRIKL